MTDLYIRMTLLRHRRTDSQRKEVCNFSAQWRSADSPVRGIEEELSGDERTFVSA